MKILTYDIERLHGVYTKLAWGPGEAFLSIDDEVEPPRTCCVAAKWLGNDTPLFAGEWTKTDKDDWLREVWQWMDEADIVITFNGMRFDQPIVYWDFAERDWDLPSPSLHIDLYQKLNKFKPASRKLAYVTQRLKIQEKQKTSSGLWLKVRNGDPAAQAEMQGYNIQDVIATEDLFLRTEKYLKLPNFSLMAETQGERACPARSCGRSLLIKGEDFKLDGFHYTQVGKYQRYQCLHCGKRSHDGKAIETVQLRPL